ncbi:MAG: fimbrillin family protein [Bacteroidales bacterium]|nr:fimbrillin family protein [Bacteroidales bacterium]
MKAFRYIALAALTFSFAACTQDEDFIPQGDADAVKITATIGALQTRVSYDERNTTFDENDQIKVVNKLRTSKNVATYTLTDEEWNTADPFVWNGASKNEFEAWYPLTASYTTFTIPTDQSSEQLLGAADWMTASSGEIDKPENQTLNLDFQHQLSKVKVTIAEWNDEFGGTAQTISSPKIYTKGTALTATYGDSGVTITATGGDTGIDPLVSGTSYTAIVAPAKYATTDKFMTFTVNGQEMNVLATPSSLNEEGLQAGLHYLFDLKVGKDAVILYSVKVTPWNEQEIVGGEAVEWVNGFSETGDYEPAQKNADGYYEIANGGNLFWFANHVNTADRTANAVLTADIDLEGRPWTPIGSTGEENNNFRGVFDGQNYTIRGLNVEGGRAGLGFFGEVRTGTVKNFTIYGEVVVNTEVDYVGGVIGSICGLNGENDLERNGAIIQNITSYVNLTAKVHGPGMIGGFVGYANHQSLIEKCSWYGTFDAGEYRVDSGAGGFIGKIQENTSEVTIRNCAAYGTIKTNYAKNSFNNTPTIYMGGFLSFSNTNAKTTLENCLFAGKFERGANLTDEARLGAFGTLRSVNAIKNCYYLGDDGLAAVHSDSNLKPGSDNVEITAVTEDDLRNNTIATQLGTLWEQGENYPVIKR